MVFQSYHQTLKAAILVSATTRLVKFESSFKRWLYSVFPWAMLSSVLPRCTSRVVWHATQLECPDLRRTHAHCTLTPAHLNKPPDGPIHGQDVCSDSSSDSEPESPEPASPGQVVADGQPPLPPLPPPPEAIVVHSTTPTANHTTSNVLTRLHNILKYIK